MPNDDEKLEGGLHEAQPLLGDPSWMAKVSFDHNLNLKPEGYIQHETTKLSITQVNFIQIIF